MITVNGWQNAPERFAIDWVQIDKDRKMSHRRRRQGHRLAFFGEPIHSVADGVVVNS